jgi:hypothetical protein
MIFMEANVPNTSEDMKLCWCPDCPTYKKSNLKGILFCAQGKAKEKVKSDSCFCPHCPIFKKYGFKQQYYCITGKTSQG